MPFIRSQWERLGRALIDLTRRLCLAPVVFSPGLDSAFLSICLLLLEEKAAEISRTWTITPCSVPSWVFKGKAIKGSPLKLGATRLLGGYEPERGQESSPAPAPERKKGTYYSLAEPAI